MKRYHALFENVSMGKGQVGLAKLARSHKIDVEKLGDGAWLFFLNAKCDKLKILAPGGETLVYHRNKTGRKLTRELIESLPELLGNKQPVTWSAAINKVFDRLGHHNTAQLRIVA